MKKRHLALCIAQLLMIALSDWLRRASWKEIDLEGSAWSPTLSASFYLLAGWLATIAVAVAFALADKRNRSMIVLFLVLVLPSIELLSWIALAF